MLKTIDIMNGELRGERAVALGFFDGVHLGHRDVISKTVEYARANNLIPAVFTFSQKDALPSSKSGIRFLRTQEQNDRIFEELGAEEVIRPKFTEFSEFTPEEFVNNLIYSRLYAKIVFCGENYRFGKGASAGVDELYELLAQRGIKLTVVKFRRYSGQEISSTRIRAAVENGEIEEANRMLDAPFCIESSVVHGNQIGRKINSPTVNQTLPKKIIHPKNGVYLTKVRIKDKSYYGVTNFGIKPTIGKNTLTCETYLLDFSEMIYGETISTFFLHYIREEKHFDSLDMLAAQINDDVKCARQLISDYKKMNGENI